MQLWKHTGSTNAIMCVYSSIHGYVRTADGPTQLFDFDCGTLQWDTLAPFLFIMVLDCVLRAVEKRVPNVGLVLKRGSMSRTRSTNALTLFDFNYADDIAFMAHSTVDAQRLLQALQIEAAACGLQTKAGEEKTAYMLFAGCVDQCITDVNGVKIPHVKKYRYLGRFFAEGDKNMNEMAIESRVKAAWTELHVYDYVWKQTNIFMSTKNLLFNAIVSSKLMFSCGSWMPSAAQMHALDTTFLSMKRYALKIPFRNNAGALQALRRGSLVKLALHVDSQLTWQFLLSSVYSHWINDYKGLENRDLLRKISKLVFARREPMLIFKVRSHNGNPHNEKVDQLADEARALQIGR